MDVAGHCGNETIVYVFVKHLEKMINSEIDKKRNSSLRLNTEDEGINAKLVSVTSTINAKIQPI